MTPGDQAGTAARRARRDQQATSAGSEPVRAGAPTKAASPSTGGSGSRDHRRGRDLDPDALAALEEERTFLLSSLDDLEREHDAGDVDDVDYEALKDDYTSRAAAVIRSIEHREAAFARARKPRSRGRTVAWIAALLVLSVVLGVIVAQASGRRDAGDSLTGDIRLTSRDLLLDARTAMGERRFLDAIEIYDEVLAAQPANVEALTYKGWLLFLTARQATDPADAARLLAASKDVLDLAVATDPAAGSALVFRAQVHAALGDVDRALADLDAVPAGSIPDDMLGTVDGLRADLEAERNRPSGTAPPGS